MFYFKIDLQKLHILFLLFLCRMLRLSSGSANYNSTVIVVHMFILVLWQIIIIVCTLCFIYDFFLPSYTHGFLLIQQFASIQKLMLGTLVPMSIVEQLELLIHS